jgi:hypothetical protein
VQRGAPWGMAHPTLDGPTVYLADGGAPEQEVDHSLAGFALARRLGADGWEVSGRLSADHIVLLARSATFGWRRRPHAASPAAQSEAPPLADLLAMDIDEVPMVSVAVENRATLDAVVLAARGAGALERMLIRCPDLELLETAAADLGHERPAFIHEAPLAAMATGPERHADRLRTGSIEGQAMMFGQWTGGLTAMFHRFGRLCVGRGATHVRMIREFAQMGIDTVSSTHPDRLDEAQRGPGSP